jgi:hypothetical protein
MSTLRSLFGVFSIIIALGFSPMASANETYFTDGSDQGFFLVRAKDDAGKTRLVGIFDHAWKVGNVTPAAKPAVSPGEAVDSFGVKFFLVDAWTLGIGGNARIQGVGTGDDTALSGEPGEKLFIAFGGLAKRPISDAWGNTWDEYVSGIFLKEFSEKSDGTLATDIRVVFRNGDPVTHARQNYPKEYPEKDSFDTVVYPDQRATGVYSPKLVEVVQRVLNGSTIRSLFVAFNAVCDGGVPTKTDDDLLQCLTFVPMDRSHDFVPYVAVSERIVWDNIPSEFSEMPWNWTLGYDGYGQANITVFLPKFLMTVSLSVTFCESCRTSNTRFASVKTAVPKTK